MSSNTLVWFRNDLRVSDHPALTDALQKNQTAKKGSVIAVYCVCLDQWRQHDMGDWRIAFQLRCLHVLQNELARLHIPLVVLNLGAFDDCAQALLEVAQKHNVGHLSFIDEYPLNERKRDAHVVKLFLEHRLYVERFIADVLVAPGVLQTGKDTPYTVFTPYYKRWKATVVGNWQGCLASPPPQSIPTDQKLPKLQEPIKIHGFDQLQLGENFWPAGEHEAQRRLSRFIDEALTDYGTGRDRPDIDGTSGLSAYLAVGCISPRQCVEALVNLGLLQGNSSAAEGATKWLSEIAWRDFYRQIVAQFDHVNKGECFRQEYNHLPWRRDNTDFIAWCEGMTGYPFVDAAMRQLNHTGWMHNRLRMLSAMFLTKHLLIDWRLGERYFMQKLVDGDFASNNGGWQWSASTGTDAAPYFRIFNPSTQQQKFDPQGQFVARWVPEAEENLSLFSVDAANGSQAAYPQPIVEHKFARERAMAFFKSNR